MKLEESHNNNILLNQISNSSLNEYIPPILFKGINVLSFNDNVSWANIKGINNTNILYDSSFNIIIDSSFNIYEELERSEVFFSDGKIGIGRKPLHTYKIDLSIPENTRTTALHIGDGVHGFSMGNATNIGFLPQIVGVGSDEDDAGLYFLSKTNNDTSSGIPLIILDSRNLNDSPLQNRPILGITSGNYNKFNFVINADGKIGINKKPSIYEMEINGELLVHDILIETLNENISLVSEINNLKERIKKLEEFIQ